MSFSKNAQPQVVTNLLYGPNVTARQGSLPQKGVHVCQKMQAKLVCGIILKFVEVACPTSSSACQDTKNMLKYIIIMYIYVVQ